MANKNTFSFITKTDGDEYTHINLKMTLRNEILRFWRRVVSTLLVVLLVSFGANNWGGIVELIIALIDSSP